MEVHPITLSGKIIRLEPLSLKHVPELALAGMDDQIWRYMLYGDMKSVEDIQTWVEDMLERQSHGTDVPFAVIYLKSGKAIGATRYMDIRPEHRGLEIGGTWYGVDYQGTGVNADAKYLLLCHAFEVLGCIRVQLKTDGRNLRSQRAIERLGAVREGLLRNHMIRRDGVIRDTVMYSITDKEWPAVRAELEDRLAAL